MKPEGATVVHSVPPLTDMTLEITNRCLLACMHCSSKAAAASSEQLSLRVAKNVMDEFKKLGGKRIEISGGEPLCHKELPRILEHAKELGLEVSLFSCGIFDPRLLRHDRNLLRKKVRELKKLKVDNVFVTLHASYAELHNSISGRNSFGQTVRFIKTLVREGIPVRVHFVPVHDNFDNIDDLETFCRHLGVQQIGILRFVPQGRGRQNEQRLRLSKEQTLELTSLVAEKAAERGSIFRVGRHLDFMFFLRPNHRRMRCHAGISKCVVTAKGQMLPCPVFKGLREFVAGDVRKSGLAEIWSNSPVFAQLRNFDPQALKGECKGCKYLSNCRGGCPAQRFYEYGRFDMGPDPYCPGEARNKPETVIPYV